MSSELLHSFIPENHIIEIKTQYVDRVSDLGVAGVIGRWGKRVSNDLITYNGFPWLYQGPEGISRDILNYHSYHMGINLVRDAIKMQNWRPEDVNALYIANSAPIDASFSENIAGEAGLSHLDPKDDIYNYFLACNSGVRALREATLKSNGNIVLLAIDRLGDMASNGERADELSRSMFGNGAVAIAFNTNNIRHLYSSELLLLKDEMRDLRAVSTYRDWIPRNGDEIYVKSGNTEVIFNPDPDEGWSSQMTGKGTLRLFMRINEMYFSEQIDSYEELRPDKPIKKMHIHQPSKRAYEMINKFYTRTIGDRYPIEWLNLEGNSSGSTALIAFLQNLQEGTNGLIGFGAGASFTFLVVDVGK